MLLRRIQYDALNARQKESYNFQKVSAALAEYGFTTIRLSDDWQGADFIARHADGVTSLMVQLKSRLTFDKKYQGRGLHVCFPESNRWYLYPHDELLVQMLAATSIAVTESWTKEGKYSFPGLSGKVKALLEPYLLGTGGSCAGQAVGLDL